MQSRGFSGDGPDLLSVRCLLTMRMDRPLPTKRRPCHGGHSIISLRYMGFQIFLNKTFRVEEMHQDFLDAGLTITGNHCDFHNN